LRIDGPAVHDDFMRRITDFTDRPLIWGQQIEVFPFSKERYVVPVRAGKRKLVGPNTHPRPKQEIVRPPVHRTKVKRAVGWDVGIQQSPGMNELHARPTSPRERKLLVVISRV